MKRNGGLLRNNDQAFKVAKAEYKELCRQVERERHRVYIDKQGHDTSTNKTASGSSMERH